MGMKDVRSRATKSAKPPAVAENRRLRLVAPKRCRWHGVVGVSDLAGDGIFGAFTLASLKRGVPVRAKKDSAGSMTDNATYWQMLQTAKPTALPCRPWTAHCRRFLETHRRGCRTGVPNGTPQVRPRKDSTTSRRASTSKRPQRLGGHWGQVISC